MADQKTGNTPETDSANARFGRAKEFVGEKYSTATESVKGGYSAVRDKVNEMDFNAMTEQVRDYVRTNPGKALLISVGVGFLIGLMLRRSDEE